MAFGRQFSSALRQIRDIRENDAALSMIRRHLERDYPAKQDKSEWAEQKRLEIDMERRVLTQLRLHTADAAARILEIIGSLHSKKVVPYLDFQKAGIPGVDQSSFLVGSAQAGLRRRTVHIKFEPNATRIWVSKGILGAGGV